jgi:hypothetical protein
VRTSSRCGSPREAGSARDRTLTTSRSSGDVGMVAIRQQIVPAISVDGSGSRPERGCSWERWAVKNRWVGGGQTVAARPRAISDRAREWLCMWARAVSQHAATIDQGPLMRATEQR